MKSTKCLVCGNETFQGSICVLCRTGITQMRNELIELLMKNNNQNSQKLKMVAQYKKYSMN